MRTARHGFAFFLTWACLLVASPSRAQSGDSEAKAGAESAPPGYAEQIKSALNEMALSNFAEAREHFRRAHAIDPSARTLRGLGMVEFELSHYVDSARLLRQALDSNVKPLSGKLRSETEALLDRAQQYVGSVRVQSEPKTAAIMVDGAVVDLGPSRTITLPVGDHVFELRADGHLPAKQVVKVDGGEIVRLDLKLVPAPRSADEDDSFAARTRESPPESKPLVRKWWLWTTIGVVMVAGAATAAILLTRKKEEPLDAYRTSNTPPNAIISTRTLGGP